MGLEGAQGEPGPIGRPGETGRKGEMGEMGIKGEPGRVGLRVSAGSNFSETTQPVCCLFCL